MGDSKLSIFKVVRRRLKNVFETVSSKKDIEEVQRCQSKLVPLSILTTLHYSAVHEIRKFAVNEHLLREDRLDEDAYAFESLASSCRDAFVESLGKERETVHCSIKLCEGTQKMAKAKWKVLTLARSKSSDSLDTTALRGDFVQEVGKNSASAALTGCADDNTKWGDPGIYNCFICGNLTKHTEYVNARPNWSSFYITAMVFPLRWMKAGENDIKIKGFLSFDSRVENIFISMPCIFDYKGKPVDYYKKVMGFPAYHVGGAIADILATTISLQDRDHLEKESENANGEPSKNCE